MEQFHECMGEYQKQIMKGVIQVAYRGLMEYIMGLRLHFKNKYPEYFVSGSIYYGYMDMTYFSFMPDALKRRKLKVAIVFIHDTCRFEVWLGGYNKYVQMKYWKVMKENDWKKYQIPSKIKGMDFIIKDIIVDTPDFSNLDSLTKQIEKETLKFIEDVESFLAKYQN